jgi:hypothetical protein
VKRGKTESKGMKRIKRVERVKKQIRDDNGHRHKACNRIVSTQRAVRRMPVPFRMIAIQGAFTGSCLLCRCIIRREKWHWLLQRQSNDASTLHEFANGCKLPTSMSVLSE